jgi:hypothetical protein
MAKQQKMKHLRNKKTPSLPHTPKTHTSCRRPAKVQNSSSRNLDFYGCNSDFGKDFGEELVFVLIFQEGGESPWRFDGFFEG